MIRRPFVVGRRGWVLIVLLLLGLLAFDRLGLTAANVAPGEGGLELAGRFFGAALQPAFEHETDWVPPGTPHLLVKVLEATFRTLLFAAAGMSLALLLGLPLGLLASDITWDRLGFGGGRLRRVAPLIQVKARVLIALMRSVHELLWAVIFLAAIGLNTFAAVIALAIPYGGTLAKVFSEMLDEAPRNTREAFCGLGASPAAAILVGLLPRALPDMAAYAFYRFECCVRSSAVLGFFGYETLGYSMRLAFEDGAYRTVWSYLYAMIGLVLVLEAWSGAVRRRLTT